MCGRDWSSDVCSSDLTHCIVVAARSLHQWDVVADFAVSDCVALLRFGKQSAY